LFKIAKKLLPWYIGGDEIPAKSRIVAGISILSAILSEVLKYVI